MPFPMNARYTAAGNDEVGTDDLFHRKLLGIDRLLIGREGVPA